MLLLPQAPAHALAEPFQFFPESELPGLFDLTDLTDSERDARSGREWCDSISAYLLWRSGTPWLRINRAAHRWSAVRWYYLDGAQLLDACFKGLTIPVQYRKQIQAAPKKPVGRHLPTLKQIKEMRG